MARSRVAEWIYTCPCKPEPYDVAQAVLDFVSRFGCLPNQLYISKKHRGFIPMRGNKGRNILSFRLPRSLDVVELDLVFDDTPFMYMNEGRVKSDFRLSKSN